jgi:hypothetical protein
MSDLSMSKSRKMGRPRVDATPLTLRLHPSLLSNLDSWIASQPDPKPTRPEAIRRLIALALEDRRHD